MQRPSRQYLIAREGWVHVGLALAAALAVHLAAGGWWALPLWALALFVLQFFRDPPRVIDAAPGTVLCPADGKVVYAGPANDPYLGREATKLSVFMDVFSVHSNRAPVGGRVKARWYHPGRFVNAALEKASTGNERNALWLRDDEGRDVVVVQIAGLVARRILCYIDEGDDVEAGERFGFIRFGSRVDVLLPPGTGLAVSLGTRVHAGSSVIARLAPAQRAGAEPAVASAREAADASR